MHIPQVAFDHEAWHVLAVSPPDDPHAKDLSSDKVDSPLVRQQVLLGSVEHGLSCSWLQPIPCTKQYSHQHLDVPKPYTAYWLTCACPNQEFSGCSIRVDWRLVSAKRPLEMSSAMSPPTRSTLHALHASKM